MSTLEWKRAIAALREHYALRWEDILFLREDQVLAYLSNLVLIWRTLPRL